MNQLLRCIQSSVEIFFGNYDLICTPQLWILSVYEGLCDPD